MKDILGNEIPEIIIDANGEVDWTEADIKALYGDDAFENEEKSKPKPKN